MGGPLQIRYVPDDPGVNHPAAWELQPMPVWGLVVLGAVMLACAVILPVCLKRQGALLANGIAVQGVVTRVVRVKGGWRVYYRFRQKEGTEAKGRSQTARRPMEGASVCVLYDPEKPRRNQTYPMKLYRVAGF